MTEEVEQAVTACLFVATVGVAGTLSLLFAIAWNLGTIAEELKKLNRR